MDAVSTSSPFVGSDGRPEELADSKLENERNGFGFQFFSHGPESEKITQTGGFFDEISGVFGINLKTLGAVLLKLVIFIIKMVRWTRKDGRLQFFL